MMGITSETRRESGDPGSEPSRERWRCLLPCFRKGTERVGSAGKALDAMNGWDPTGGCLYYYNPKTAVDGWIRTRTVKTVIGNHSFAV